MSERAYLTWYGGGTDGEWDSMREYWSNKVECGQCKRQVQQWHLWEHNKRLHCVEEMGSDDETRRVEEMTTEEWARLEGEGKCGRYTGS